MTYHLFVQIEVRASVLVDVSVAHGRHHRVGKNWSRQTSGWFTANWEVGESLSQIWHRAARCKPSFKTAQGSLLRYASDTKSMLLRSARRCLIKKVSLVGFSTQLTKIYHLLQMIWSNTWSFGGLISPHVNNCKIWRLLIIIFYFILFFAQCFRMHHHAKHSGGSKREINMSPVGQRAPRRPQILKFLWIKCFLLPIKNPFTVPPLLLNLKNAHLAYLADLEESLFSRTFQQHPPLCFASLFF